MRVAGIDCSARFTSIVVCDAETGHVLRRGRARHPAAPGTLPVEAETSPSVWLHSLCEAADGGLLDDVDAVGVAAQQHGMVPLDGNGAVVRPALLHEDGRDTAAAEELLADLGDPADWARELGTVPQPGWTAAKLRWLACHEPDRAERVEQVLLPHDWLTWQLTGRRRRCTTDRGDASGTGYWSPRTGRYRADLLELALGHETVLPHVLGPAEAAGRTSDGVLVSAGTGETMAAALGLGLRPGDAVVSLAGAGAVFAVHDAPLADPPGRVVPLADAEGRFLPLVRPLHAGLLLRSAAELLGTDQTGLHALAERSRPGAGGLVALPHRGAGAGLALPHGAGTLTGPNAGEAAPEDVARAVLEGLLCGFADALDLLRAGGAAVRRVVLLGGAARRPLVRQAAPELFGAPALLPEAGTAEYAVRGAARQAAWALSAARHGPGTGAPVWPGPGGRLLERDGRERTTESGGEVRRAGPARAAWAGVREQYAAALGGARACGSPGGGGRAMAAAR